MRRYSSADWTDDKLLDLIRQEDDRAAFAELYDRYWEKLVNVSFQRLKSRELAKELVQDLFVTLFVRRRELRPQSSLEAYLMTAVRNQVFRKFHLQASNNIGQAKLISVKQDMPELPDELLEAKELRVKIYQATELLPDKCREVFILSRFEQLSHKDIAEQLNISVSTVKKHITKALSIIRHEINDHHLDVFAFCFFMGLTVKLSV